jgi:hypothetical protein
MGLTLDPVEEADRDLGLRARDFTTGEIGT